jgi:cysteine desulfurase/selenocysteine lyase
MCATRRCLRLGAGLVDMRIAANDQRIVEKIIQELDRDRFRVLSPESGHSRSTLVVIRPIKMYDGLEWQRRLDRAGIDVAVREGNLRIAPHVHNTMDDADRLLKVLGS